MALRRFVTLDQDNDSPGGLHVVVRAPTGVRYRQQYGGTACLQGQVEGYLVPVFEPDALAALRQLFEVEYGGAGTGGGQPGPEAERLRAVVATVPYWSCDGIGEERGFLRLDDSLLREADEAWVPVLTPDGPGVLLWANSD